jgi:hypothetical protein
MDLDRLARQSQGKVKAERIKEQREIYKSLHCKSSQDEILVIRDYSGAVC